MTSIQRISSLNSMQSKIVRRALDKSDVAEVEVAMTFAHEALATASRHRGRASGVLALRPRGQRSEFRDLRLRVQKRPDLREVLQRRSEHGCRGAEGSADTGHARRVVNAATLAASVSMWTADNSPRTSTWLARPSCGNSRIFTAYSMAGPLPPRTGASTLPVIATTSR
jgi:hypothetical protein